MAFRWRNGPLTPKVVFFLSPTRRVDKPDFTGCSQQRCLDLTLVTSSAYDRRQEQEPMDWEDVPFLPQVSAPFVPSRPPRKMRSLISVQVSEPPSLSANRFPNMRALVPKNRIVTGDETWLSHITPESKQQSMEWRQTSSTVKIKAQNYGNCVLGPALCFAGGLHDTRNNDRLGCLLHNSKKAPVSIGKQTARHAVKRCFAPPR
ncbi:hypothetical protein TNCV_2053921 [Trichonephila clavipes]|nr:hypothetical protein TNCV_2053921 [Trichonephila clavipes]